MGLSESQFVLLSGSVPDRYPFVAGARPTDIEEAIVSLARAVFSRGGRMIFGGHPSVSPLIASIAGTYFPPDPNRPPHLRPIVTFQSEFFRDRLPDESWALYRMGWSAIEWTETVDQDRNASLLLMRRDMLGVPGFSEAAIERNRIEPPRAMVAIGGMEGILEETRIILSESSWDLPLYAVASGGGAASQLARVWPERVRGLEAVFQEANAAYLPPETSGPVPYAAMMQWLVDSL